MNGKRLLDYVMTPFDDPSIFAEKDLGTHFITPNVQLTGFEDGRATAGTSCCFVKFTARANVPYRAF